MVVGGILIFLDDHFFESLRSWSISYCSGDRESLRVVLKSWVYPCIDAHWPIFDIGKCRRRNLLPEGGGKLHRLFHSSMLNNRYLTSVNARRATCRRRAASRTGLSIHRWPIIRKSRRCNLPMERGRLHRLSDSSMPDDIPTRSFVACGINAISFAACEIEYDVARSMRY